MTSKSRISLRDLPRGLFHIDRAILIVGDIAPTGAASASPPVIGAMPAWLWDAFVGTFVGAFVGAFGFREAIQNRDGSLKGSRVLTITIGSTRLATRRSLTRSMHTHTPSA